MASTLSLPDRRPMRLRDQHGATAHAWFPPYTPTDPAHVLPARVYAEVCRLAGVAPSSPWVAFHNHAAALAAVVAVVAAGRQPPGAGS
jgi:hypothetical protein